MAIGGALVHGVTKGVGAAADALSGATDVSEGAIESGVKGANAEIRAQQALRVASNAGDELTKLYQEHGLKDLSNQSTTANTSTATTTPMAPQAEEPAHDFRSLIAKSPTEIRNIADEATARDKNLLTDLFGDDDAKRYAGAQRTVNSSQGHLDAERYDAANKTIQDLEGKLSNAQRDRLFGIGQKGLAPDELREAARIAEEHSPANLADWDQPELESTVGRELTTGAPHQDIVSALRLRGAVDELQRRQPNKPLEEIVLDGLRQRVSRGHASPGDALDLVRARMGDLRRGDSSPSRRRGSNPAPPNARSPIVQHQGTSRAASCQALNGRYRRPRKRRRPSTGPRQE